MTNRIWKLSDLRIQFNENKWNLEFVLSDQRRVQIPKISAEEYRTYEFTFSSPVSLQNGEAFANRCAIFATFANRKFHCERHRADG